MKYPEKVLLKLESGTLARIDACSENRSDFIRGAISSALGDDLPADARVLLDRLRRRPSSSRDAERHFGWLGLRYSKAERALLDRELIRVRGGVLEVCE